jgi:aminopeptidase N
MSLGLPEAATTLGLPEAATTLPPMETVSLLRSAFAVALLFVAPLAQAATAPHSAPPNLPISDVIRLSEEWEAKSAPDAQARTLAASLSPEADSLHSYDARHYRLDVTPSRTQNLISGTMTLDLLVVDPGIVNVDLFDTGLNVTAARVNGSPRTFTVSNGELLIPICQGADCPSHGAGDSLQVAVDYSASPPSRGFYFYPRNSYTFAEPYDGRYWWPCYDLPNDKATLDVYATVPDTNVCVSNGVLVSVTPAGPGMILYHWQETHPIATYLVAITVGNFWQWNQVTASGPVIPILENVFPEDSTKARYDFGNVPAMIPLFANRFGPYAFDKYGMVAVTPFGAGGMEHQSLTTINRSWITGDRSAEQGMAHELTHQWWGDKVTCVDFRNIWLNEGFASYGECIWEGEFYGQASYDAAIQAQMTAALNADNNIRYALYDPPPANLFGQTIYKKGSLVLHMLRRILGDTAFFAGMQLYGSRFAYGTASSTDFEQAMEDATGQPLDWYFNEWVFDKGLPSYNWAWQAVPTPDSTQTQVSVYVRQVQTNAPYFQMPIEFQVQRNALPDTFVTATNQALAEDNLILTVNGTVTNVVFDPHNSIYKTVQQITVGAPPVLPVSGPAVALTIGPNPARSSAQFQVELGAADKLPIEVRLYNSAGRWIRTLGPVPAARRADLTWDLRDASGRRIAPGLYFAQARVGANHEEKSIVVVP